MEPERETPELLRAAQRGDLAEVQRRIRAGESPSTVGFYDLTQNVPVLSVAAYSRQVEIVEFLLQQGASVHEKDEAGRTPLHCAAWSDAKISRILITHGAKVNAQDNEGNTPLFDACLNGNYSSLSLLLSQGGDSEIENKEKQKCFEKARERETWDSLSLKHSKNISIDLLTHKLFLAAFCGEIEKVQQNLDAGESVDFAGKMSGQTLLFAASHSGNIDLVRLLLDRGANVQQKDEMESTALHCSITPEISRLLIHRGADIHAKDKEGQTPLHFAAETSGDTQLFQTLIELGANVSEKNTDGETPLHLAARSQRNVRVCALLIEYGANVHEKSEKGMTPLHCVARTNQNTEIFELLIQKGAVVDERDKDGQTPLHYAALSNENAFICEELIKHGAAVCATDKTGQTPMHLAAMLNENTQIFHTLFMHGAKLDAKTESGGTPLHSACNYGNLIFVSLILKHGGERVCVARDEEGRTPLHCAAADAENSKVCDILIQHGASVDDTITSGYNKGKTALHLACWWERFQNVVTLLKHGANIHATDEEGETPLLCAAARASAQICELLIQHGARVDDRDEERKTPLHRAADVIIDADKAICETLIRHGAQLDVQDARGDTPLHLACDNGNSHIVAVLLIHGASANIQNEDGDTPTQKTRIRGWESEAKQHSKRECVDLLTQWRALRPLPAFCVLKVCERHIDISRLPRHLQQEITEIREAPIQQWPMLIDRLTQRRAGVEPAHTQT
eukprot:TRINITY_DN1789_c0_g1_i1.p1 TRINITY_DN1789_c0_g1~~TRINITY_DN1789_c0_g1_i1.p1  ORF type:complete len:809 (-),score=207.18 TRINITY_DN1789_c0_g1_i1:137-2359(-)